MMFFRRREPSQLETLIALVAYEVAENPDRFCGRTPSHSGKWTLLSSDNGEILLTCMASACGDRLYDFRLNGQSIRKKDGKALVRVLEAARKAKAHKAAMEQNEILLDRMIARRQQKRLK
jgi:hypothetical protein